jgi:hypothetical protein
MGMDNQSLPKKRAFTLVVTLERSASPAKSLNPWYPCNPWSDRTAECKFIRSLRSMGEANSPALAGRRPGATVFNPTGVGPTRDSLLPLPRYLVRYADRQPSFLRLMDLFAATSSGEFIPVPGVDARSSPTFARVAAARETRHAPAGANRSSTESLSVLISANSQVER